MMILNKTLKLTRKLLKQNGIKGWKVSTNRSKRNFAFCSYENKTISFSSILIPNCKDEYIIDTIYHEIAHILTEGHNHNKVWKQKFIELGGSGLIYGDDEHYIDGGAFLLKICKYYIYCKHCDKKIPYYRRPKRTFYCDVCDKKMKLIKNRKNIEKNSKK